MAFLDLLLAQLSDPFRIGMIAALALTTAQTSAHTGGIIPLLLGVVFIAVLIPTTMGSGEATAAMAVAVGLLANAIILAAIVALYLLWKRLSRAGGAP